MNRQKIRTMIVDDDSGIRHLIGTLLQRYFIDHIELIAEADSVESAVSSIRANEPQLLFLDVDLQDGMGFEVLDLLGEDRKKLHVIFITSHGTKFMHRAMRHDAVDYLDKPIEPSEFKIGVERGIMHILERQALQQQRPSAAPKRSTMLCIRHNTGNETIVPIHTITHCKADNNYTRICLTDKRPIIASKTLKHYEEVLEKHGFVRVSRGILINPDYCIIKLDKKNAAFIQMPDGSFEQVDPAYQDAVKQELLEIME